MTEQGIRDLKKEAKKKQQLASEAKRLGEEATGHETMSATINTNVS